MRVYAGINAKDRKDFIWQLKRARKTLPKNSWLHIDISDPSFSSIKSYFDLKILKRYSSWFNFEAHLMVPEEKILGLIKSPLKRVWIHSSIVKDWDIILKKSKVTKIQIGAVVEINQPKRSINIPLQVKSILVLAVVAGPSGQKFRLSALKLISFLRKKYPHAKIIVDGGVNQKVAKKLADLKVDGVVSTSYIWSSQNPKKAYEILKSF
jgi:pentose-5-phosphate-3-epimerase